MKQNIKYILNSFVIALAIIFLQGCVIKKTNIGVIGNCTDKSKMVFNRAINYNVDVKNIEKLSKEKYISYNDIDSLLNALDNGDVDEIILDEVVAKFLLNKKNGALFDVKYSDEIVSYSLCMNKKNEELCNQISVVLNQLEMEGFTKIINTNFIDNVISGVNPIPFTILHFDNAPTYKVGVSGDFPPIDFIDDNDKAAGYSVAMLNEIAKRMGINIELVNIDSNSMVSALDSGFVDILFCAQFYTDGVNNFSDNIFTIPYYQSNVAVLKNKNIK